MKSGLYVVAMLCLCLSGCIKQREKSLKETQSNAAFSLVQKGWNALTGAPKGQVSAMPERTVLESREFQAILKDISLPITYYQSYEKPFFTSYSSDEYRLCFITPITMQQLLAFYRQEMELAGWREWAIICHDQLLAIFKKPFHIAVIEAQLLDEDSSQVTITVHKRVRKNHD
jgi:hypothetical protein